MRTAILSLAAFWSIMLMTAIAMANPTTGHYVTNSSGVVLMSGTGEPITHGEVIIENGGTVDIERVPAEFEDREITKHKSFIGGLKKGLHKKGFSYQGWGSYRWTKTVQVQVSPAMVIKTRNGRQGGNEGPNGNGRPGPSRNGPRM